MNGTCSFELAMNLLTSPIETSSFFLIPSLLSIQEKSTPTAPLKLEEEGIIG